MKMKDDELFFDYKQSFIKFISNYIADNIGCSLITSKVLLNIRPHIFNQPIVVL